jgi:hypothetical protein
MQYPRYSSPLEKSSSGMGPDIDNFLFLKEISLIDLLKIVSKTTKLSSESILSISREKKIFNARSSFAFIAARYAGFKNKRN